MVKGRITKFAYGVPYCVPFKHSDKEHVMRKHKMYTDELGDKYIPDAYDTMLSKVWHKTLSYPSQPFINMNTVGV